MVVYHSGWGAKLPSYSQATVDVHVNALFASDFVWLNNRQLKGLRGICICNILFNCCFYFAYYVNISKPYRRNILPKWFTCFLLLDTSLSTAV